MKRLTIFLATVLLLASCRPASPSPDTAVTSPPMDNMTTSTPNEPNYLPQPGDSSLTRGNVYIDSTEFLIRESFPPQISLGISGSLPTPCHQLRVDVHAPDSENRIQVKVYSVVDPNQVCIQVLKSFEQYINFGTFPTGHYTVWVNGDKVGEFDT